MAGNRQGPPGVGPGKGTVIDSGRRVSDSLGLVQAKPPLPMDQMGSQGGTLVVDRVGNVLAFDRGFERLTGWMAFEVIGRHKDLGFYGTADEHGVRGFQPRSLFEGKVPEVGQSTVLTLTINRRDGVQLETEALVSPLGSNQNRFEIKVYKVIARLGHPDENNRPKDMAGGAGEGAEKVFIDRLVKAVHRCHGAGQPLAVMEVALDNREQFLETYGHTTAQDIMNKVAGLVRATLREVDYVDRLDENRIGVLLETSGRGDARQIGGRIRSTVEKFLFKRPMDPQTLHVTVSIGAASYPTDSEAGPELLRRASEALGEAQRMGGNRVWCYVRRPRVHLITPVFFDGLSLEPLGTSRDLSNSGIFVETEDLLPMGMRLGLLFRLPGIEEPLRIMGRVARQALPHPRPEPKIGGMGIEFERFSPEVRRQIESFIMEMIQTS